MSDTLNKFLTFIKEDPVMLGLCIAIVVLIIIFFLVLILGKKKTVETVEPKEIDLEKDIFNENTSTLFKKDEIEEKLRSTGEYNVLELTGGEEVAEPSSVATEPATVLVSESTMTLNDALNLSTNPELVNELEEKTIVMPKVELETEPVSEVMTEPIVISEETPEFSEPTLTPVNDLVVNEVEIPIEVQTSEVKVETPVAQPFSSVTVGNEPLPIVEPSTTEIIKHVEEPVSVEEDDDLDLPKLNTNNSNSVLSVLQGETYKLNK